MNATLPINQMIGMGVYLPFLILAHCIGDWLIQSDYEAMNKAKGKFWNRALLTHCIKYTLCFVPVLYAFGESQLWLSLIFWSHMFIDRRTPVIWWRVRVRGSSIESVEKTLWVTIVVDQVFHFIILMIMVAAKLAKCL